MPYERFAAGKTSAEAEFTAQPLAALPPYGCGVPLAGASAEHFNRPRNPKRNTSRQAGVSFCLRTSIWIFSFGRPTTFDSAKYLAKSAIFV